MKDATGWFMVGKPDDTNSIADPLHVVPQTMKIADASSQWTHTFPGNSVSVMRFKTNL